MRLTDAQITEFHDILTRHYDAHGRHDLPWRLPGKDGFDPYRIVVSELMLQQTQVPRVIPKYHEFLQLFPDVQTLAAASLGDVLRVWQGLGYNRRAKFLWQTAQQVVGKYGGVFPDSPEGLTGLPGIGANTAGAVLAYAYDRPAVFIETNVRTVYIHHFFTDRTGVSDADIRDLLEHTLDHRQPRQFYWMLMDYGSYLKRAVSNNIRRSRHYARQSPFAGSRRQVRGAVLRALADRGYAAADLQRHIPDSRLQSVLAELVGEGFIHVADGTYRLA